jgi:hypothetical protein
MPNAKSRVVLATELSKLIKSLVASEARAKTPEDRLQLQQTRDYLQSGYLVLTGNDDVTQVHTAGLSDDLHSEDNALD